MVEDKESQNLWSTLLRESSKRFKAPEATCIFCGDRGIGKSSLVSMIGGNSNYDVDGNGGIIKDIISYAFLDVDEGVLDSDSVSKINVWSINNKTFDNCMQNVIKPDKQGRLLFMVGIDVSSPENCFENLKYWLRKIRKYASQRHQAARGVTVGNYTDLKWNELNIQIIIIACKSDLLKIDDAGSLKMARTLQGQVRTVALFIGAAVIYTSTETDTNTVKLRKYLISKLFPEALSVEDNIEDGMVSAFIPYGTDSPELIRIATGVSMSLEGEEIVTMLDTVVVSGTEEEDLKQDSSTRINLTTLELESEEEWLGGLQNFISEVTSSGIVASSSAGSIITTVSAENAVGEAVKTVPRRSFRVPVAAQEKQDVDDFFQKLLIGGGGVPVPKK